MYKRILALTFLFMLLACTSKPSERILKGKIIAANGKFPARADIHILEFGQNPYQDAKMYPVEKNGAFEIQLPKESYLQVMVTATDHKPLLFPLITENLEKSIELKIQLQGSQFVDDFSYLRITGNWNDFSFSDAQPMQQQEDSTYIFTRTIDSDTAAYQLLNIVMDGRSVNGQQAIGYEYDGGGDYYSLVKTKDKTLTVKFDPAKLTRSNTQANVKVLSQQEDLAKILELSVKSTHFDLEERDARQNYFNKHNNLIGFNYDRKPIIKEIADLLQSSYSNLVKRYAALTLAHYTSPDEKNAIDAYKIIVEILTLNDPLWAAEDMGVNFIYQAALGEENAIKLFNQQLPNITNRKVRASILVHFGFNAKAKNNQERMREIYNDLKTNYNDIGEIGYFVEQLNPDLRIAVGKKVPDFKLKLLGSGKEISNTSLLGTYYILDFWATWCNPCVGEMPYLHTVHKKYGKQNFTIISVSFDRAESDITTFRKEKWSMPWLHSFPQGKESDKISAVFEVTGIPKPVLVNPDGVIIAMEGDLRGENLEKTLSNFMN